MALVWGESFDIYGTNTTFLSQNGYTDTSNVSISITAGQARTGTGCLVLGNSFSKLRRALDTPQPTVGVGVGFMVTSIPGTNNQNRLGIVSEAVLGTIQIAVTPLTDLSLGVWNGSTLVGQTPANTLSLNTYAWVEVKIIKNSAGANTGYVEVRVNGGSGIGGVTLIVNNTDIPNNVAFVTLGSPVGGQSASGFLRLDDFVIWDGTGTRNNNFLGDRRCLYSPTNADTATQQWVPSTGTNAWSILANDPPIDTTFISGNNVGDVCEVEKAPLTINTNDVAGVIVFGRINKTDAGTSTARLGVHSGATVSNGPAFAPGTAFGYFRQMFEINPDTGNPWTKAEVDAAAIRITRDS